MPQKRLDEIRHGMHPEIRRYQADIELPLWIARIGVILVDESGVHASQKSFRPLLMFLSHKNGVEVRQETQIPQVIVPRGGGLWIDLGGSLVGCHGLADLPGLLQHVRPVAEGVSSGSVKFKGMPPGFRRLGDPPLQIERIAEGVVGIRDAGIEAQRLADQPFGFKRLSELDAHPGKIPEIGGWYGIPRC
jgi:hypothetical protein